MVKIHSERVIYHGPFIWYHAVVTLSIEMYIYALTKWAKNIRWCQFRHSCIYFQQEVAGEFAMAWNEIYDNTQFFAENICTASYPT